MKASIIGQPLKHIAFGEGTVSNINGNIIEVQFSEGIKKFLYPDAFSKYLILQDEQMQSEIVHLNNIKLKKEKAVRMKRNEEQEKMWQLRTLKIVKNSQAAFNIPFSDISKLSENCEVFTGCYLSGYSKGQPRIPNKINPNSACLLTALPDEKDESSRRIIGVFMVGEDFIGENCKDGIIKAHSKYSVFLPSDKYMPYWNYFEQSARVSRWGQVPFKYFDNITMQSILSDMVRSLKKTNKATAAKNFYRYFCELNRLPADSVQVSSESKK